jgi:transcriptional regulator NrdR family protein
MRNEGLKQATLKRVVDKNSETIIAIQSIYDRYTGRLKKTEEKIIRLDDIDSQIAKLNKELDILQGIRKKVIEKQFDKVEDRRPIRKSITDETYLGKK